MRVEAKIAGMLPPDYLASLHETLRNYPLLFFRGQAGGGEGVRKIFRFLFYISINYNKFINFFPHNFPRKC